MYLLALSLYPNVVEKMGTTDKKQFWSQKQPKTTSDAVILLRNDQKPAYTDTEISLNITVHLYL